MRPRRPVRLTLAFGFVLVALPALAVPVAGGDGSDRAGAEGATAEPSHGAIVAHWTPERMRAAIPRDFEFDPVRGFRPAAEATEEPTEEPAEEPAEGADDPAAAAPPPAIPAPTSPFETTAGASWTDGQGAIYRATGRVFFEMGGEEFTCSGAVATDSRTDVSLVLTAGHCAYDEVGGEFATNWLFIPQFDGTPRTRGAPTLACAAAPYGCWTAEALVVHSGFATAGRFNAQATRHDWAFAVMGPGGTDGATQLDSLGSFPGVSTAYPVGTSMYAFGYPAAGRFEGDDLSYCAGPAEFDPRNDFLTYRLECDLTSGSSGGPWLSSFDPATGDTGLLSSLISYSLAGVRAVHGPKFDENTADTYAAADSAIANTIVP